MGYAHVFWIYEDDLNDLLHRKDGTELIGRAVLEIFRRGGSGADHEKFPMSSPGLCRVGRFHSGDFAPLVWSRNCLQLLDWGELRPDERDALLKSHSPAPPAASQSRVAASRCWQMLTGRIQDLDGFGNRVLLTLFRSPMTALAWGMAEAPGSLQELNDSRSGAGRWRRVPARSCTTISPGSSERLRCLARRKVMMTGTWPASPTYS